jgi:hypothetical protein
VNKNAFDKIEPSQLPTADCIGRGNFFDLKHLFIEEFSPNACAGSLLLVAAQLWRQIVQRSRQCATILRDALEPTPEKDVEILEDWIDGHIDN